MKLRNALVSGLVGLTLGCGNSDKDVPVSNNIVVSTYDTRIREGIIQEAIVGTPYSFGLVNDSLSVFIKTKDNIERCDAHDGIGVLNRNLAAAAALISWEINDVDIQDGDQYLTLYGNWMDKKEYDNFGQDRHIFEFRSIEANGQTVYLFNLK